MGRSLFSSVITVSSLSIASISLPIELQTITICLATGSGRRRVAGNELTIGSFMFSRLYALGRRSRSLTAPKEGAQTVESRTTSSDQRTSLTGLLAEGSCARRTLLQRKIRDEFLER